MRPAKMLLLPSVYSSPERYEIKTPFERKVTERGFLGLVYQEPIFSMNKICRNALCCLKLKDRERDITGDRPFDQSLNETEDLRYSTA